MRDPALLLVVLDLLGVFVFALSGATLAAAKGFDVVGMLVLALAAGLGGGLLRDLLLGDLPPPALRDARYLLAPLAAAVATFLFAAHVHRLLGAVRLFDAAGLGLFVAAGTTKALDAGLGAAGAIVLGCLTGVGGGVVRDVLARDVPVVLQRELYAVPARAGAGVLVVADGSDVPRAPAAAAAALLVAAFRVVALLRDWHAPRAVRRR